MPQVVGDRVVTASGTGKIHSLDKKTGKPKWSHDLYNEFHATHLQYGYACHALPYKDMLIYQAGGQGDGVIAFRQSDGAVVWKALQFTNSYSSPLLINVDGQTAGGGAGGQDGVRIQSRQWRAALDARARDQLRVGGQHARVGAREPAVRGFGVRHGRARAAPEPVRREDQSGPALVRSAPGVAHRDGHPARWLRVHFARLQRSRADDRGGAEDRKDHVAGARFCEGAIAVGGWQADPGRPGWHAGFVPGDSAEVRGAFEGAVLQSISWTPPTLVGTRLYMRDRKTIAAYDLGN